MEVIIKKANEFKGCSHKEIADFFWNELGSYVKNPMFQTLQNMKYAYLLSIHDDHELAKTFEDAMKWSGIENIFSEFEKQGWD